MRTAGTFAAAILGNKPSGAILSQFPLVGLPQPEFAKALRDDALSLTYAGHISLGEAISRIKRNSYTWATTQLYYAAFYYIKASLAYDDVVIFYHNNREYITDAVDGYTQEFGRSSHQFGWNKISNITRLTGWNYEAITGDAFARLRVMREEANYKRAFFDPLQRPEYRQMLTGKIERVNRTYKTDDSLLYTFLDQHVALALPIALATNANLKMKAASASFSEQQLIHLRQVWPFTDVGLW